MVISKVQSSVFPKSKRFAQPTPAHRLKKMPPKGSSKNHVSIESSLKIPPCEPKKCRINCRKNPNCFSQLGEKFWFNAIKDSHWTTSEDPNTERRVENSHVGLKNLGATCYVNTFLQLWFHNKALRRAVYQWECGEPPIETVEPVRSEDEIEITDITEPKYIALSFGGNSTKAICGSLQYLFSLLDSSKRRYVDPSPLVKSLGLQTDEQQDAQEFSKLFISLLQEALSSQGQAGNVIDGQFGGIYVYETKCGFCQSVSERPSNFYELDLNIKGHLKLSQCLKEFLKEEILEGDNQYYCSTCLTKQDATRRIALRRLPKVLNLQLLRFVFDRQTFAKKKLNNVINFPDILDMNEFVKLEKKEDGIYHLKAVLIHKGLSANSGHYIAHIWDQQNEVWCRFNDESVDVVKGKTLQLEKEEKDDSFLEETTKGKAPKIKKLEGSHNSKNAYMLVYMKKTEIANDNTHVEPPEYMADVVERDNTLFEDWVDAVSNQRNKVICEGLKKQEEVKGIYSRLNVQEGEDYEWISTKWLRSWLSPEQRSVPPIDNTELMCSHSCFDPLKISQAKRVAATAAFDLFNKHGGLPRFKADSMCKKCLDFIKNKEIFENKIQDDLKLLSKYLKQAQSNDGYWVGKKSLKNFRQLAVKEFMNNCDVGVSLEDQSSVLGIEENGLEPADDSNNNNNNNTEQKVPLLNQDVSVDTTCSPLSGNKVNSQSKVQVFNQDVVCVDHGNLCLNENLRKLVSKDIWTICLRYFPSLKEFPTETLPCAECLKKQQSDEEEKETLKMFVANQKECLSFLFHDPKERLDAFLARESTGSFYIITSNFVNMWKRKMKFQRAVEESIIDNTDMICEHDLSLYSPEELIDELAKSDPEVVIILPDEKQVMCNFFAFVPEVKVTMTKSCRTGCLETTYESSPVFCPDCRSVRLSEEAFDSKSFTNAPIYVRKLTKDHNITVNESTKTADNTSPDEVRVTDDVKLVKEEHKQKREAPVEATSSPKRFKGSPAETGAKRRSTRYRRQRGEYVIYVDSHQTLRELKVQLLPVFSVFPMEQILTFDDGIALTEDDKCLVDLGVTPGKHLYLSVAEQDKNQIDVHNQGKERTIEEGFKGEFVVAEWHEVQTCCVVEKYESDEMTLQDVTQSRKAVTNLRSHFNKHSPQ